MANGGSTWVVKVVWQAVPDSLNYFDLSDADRETVDSQMIDQINSLVPPSDQSKWECLIFTVATFDELASKVGSLLQLEAKPPAGSQLAFTEAMTLWIPRPPQGHEIVAAAMLKYSGETTLRPWSFEVPHGTANYTGRVGLNYQCSHARVP